jgi:DNA-binding transcriptional LysR family regulator
MHNGRLCPYHPRMELDGVRTFVAIAETGQFQAAAANLAVTQQAVSKRVAALELSLGVRLFTRTPRGAALTIDGQALLPHARELLQAEERAAASVRPGQRALRVDVINRRIAPAGLMHAFYRAHPEVELDLVTLSEANASEAVEAVATGTIDATFRAIRTKTGWLPKGLRSALVIDDGHEILVGPRNEFADAPAVTPAELVGRRIWMPGMAAGTEWFDYYEELAAELDLEIDVVGPHFGNEALLAEIADSAELTTFVGAGSQYLWPASYDLRRVPVRNPTPVYPHSLVWSDANPHPALAALRAYLESNPGPRLEPPTWVPSWARP